MIQLSRNYSLPEKEDDLIPIKVIGVGGAGANALDRMVLDGLDKADLVVANTDVQALAGSVATHKVQLGRMATRGLGTGGDPQLGYEAATEAADEIRQALHDARIIFVCAGLGGGTGSGAAPIVAELAREAGALVVSFATLPFPFEGKRRAAQAEQALVRLHEVSDAVICFENEKLGDIVAPKAGVHQAFAAADQTISQSVRAIMNVIQRPGLIRIGFDDLLAALRAPNSRCLFGYGESDSDNRAHDALTTALKSPLMDRGRLLAGAANVLVQVAGGPGMTLAEVEALMHELNRHVDDETQILFGTAVDGRMGNRIAVTLISSLSADGAVAQKPLFVEPVRTPAPPKRTPPPAATPQPSVMESLVDEEELEIAPTPEPEEPARPLQMIEAVLSPQQELLPVLPVDEELLNELPVQAAAAPQPLAQEPEEPAQPAAAEPLPRVIPPKKKVVMPKELKPLEKIIAKQEVLQFESVTRGRFEKSEPTIVEGQDLDVPTFMRKNVRVK
jgi:cell division protein FtsZ